MSPQRLYIAGLLSVCVCLPVFAAIDPEFVLAARNGDMEALEVEWVVLKSKSDAPGAYDNLLTRALWEAANGDHQAAFEFLLDTAKAGSLLMNQNSWIFEDDFIQFFNETPVDAALRRCDPEVMAILKTVKDVSELLLMTFFRFSKEEISQDAYSRISECLIP